MHGNGFRGHPDGNGNGTNNNNNDDDNNNNNNHDGRDPTAAKS